MIKGYKLEVDENGRMVGLDEVTLDKILEAITGFTKEQEKPLDEMEAPSREVVIEPDKAYLILNRCKEIVELSTGVYNLIEKTATDSNVLEMGVSMDNDTIVIVFDNIKHATNYRTRLASSIKKSLEHIDHLGTAITASEVGLFIIGAFNDNANVVYSYCNFDLSNKDGHIVCEVGRGASDTPLSDINKLCKRLGFRSLIGVNNTSLIDGNKNKCANDVEKELDNEQFPHLVESYKPDYLDKQEKLAIIQEMNVIHTSFYGVFRDTLLGMSGLALHSLKNELNNNNLKGALEILLKHIKG